MAGTPHLLLERQTQISRAGELVTSKMPEQRYFDLIRGDLRGIAIFSWKTGRVCVRTVE